MKYAIEIETSDGRFRFAGRHTFDLTPAPEYLFSQEEAEARVKIWKDIGHSAHKTEMLHIKNIVAVRMFIATVSLVPTPHKEVLIS